MQVIEIVVSREAKRSNKPYESDGYFALVKAQVHPGDDVQKAIAEAQRVVDAALEAAVRGTTPAAPPAPVMPTWHVKVDGPKAAAGAALSSVGLRFADGYFVGEFTNKHDADKAADVASTTYNGARITVTPPPGGA